MNSRRSYSTLLPLLLWFFWVQTETSRAEDNLALKRNTSQSSNYGVWIAEKAVDGSRTGSKLWSVCSSTANQSNPWWRVDLGDVYRVSRVIITNINSSVADRINGAQIHIGNSLENNGSSNPMCAVISSIPAGASATFLCCFMEGRYVNLFIPGDSKMLTLCEVEVYVEGPCWKQSLVKLKLNSSFSVSEVRLLTQLESALAQRGVSDVTLRWTQLPKQEVMRKEAAPAQCAPRKKR